MIDACTWDFHGVRVRLESELGIPRVLAYGLRHRMRSNDGEARIRIRVRLGPATPAPERGVHIRLVRTWPAVGMVSNQRFWLAAGGGTVDGDLVSGCVDVAAPAPEWLAAPTVVRTLVPVAIETQLACRGRFRVHTAVVVDPEGRGWMLAGGGGVGKSTTTYRLLEEGWSYLCDDSALVAIDGSVVALGYWDELQLDRDIAARLGTVQWMASPSPNDSKGVVATAELFGGRRVDRVEVSRLVFLRRERSVFDRPRLAALTQLIDDNRLLLVHATEENFDAFTRLVGQCRIGSAVTDGRLLHDPVAALTECIEPPRRMAPTPEQG